VDADFLFGLALFQALFLNSGKGRHQIFAMMCLEIEINRIFSTNVSKMFSINIYKITIPETNSERP